MKAAASHPRVLLSFQVRRRVNSRQRVAGAAPRPPAPGAWDAGPGFGGRVRVKGRPGGRGGDRGPRLGFRSALPVFTLGPGMIAVRSAREPQVVIWRPGPDCTLVLLAHQDR